MTPYLILLFSAVGIAYLGRRFGSLGIRRLTIFLIGGLFVLFAGLRDRSVGADTGNYISWLNSVNSLEDVVNFHVEIGFGLLVFFGGFFSDGYAVYLSLIALLVVAFYLITILRLVPRFEVAVFVFITLSFYTFFFNGARQGIAAAICFFALPWLLERKAVLYISTIAFAALFHKSALIALPLYFVVAKEVGWRELILVVFGSVLLSVTLSTFAQLAAAIFDERYATYGQAGEGGGRVQAAFLIIQGALLIFFKKQVGHDNTTYSRLLNIYLIGLVPALASVIGSVNPSGLLRLTMYFSHTSILLWPMVFLSFRNIQSRTILFAVFLFFALGYFVATTSTFSSLTPYRLNMELFQ